MASLQIDDNGTAELVEQLAAALGTSKTEAVRLAVREKLARQHAGPAAPKRSVQDVMQEFWRTHPLPPPTGLAADKAFLDSLSGQ